MSDETQTIERNEGIAVPGEVAPQTTQTSGESAPDVESRARSQGWVAQDEWRGDPDKWRPADEFVKRGEELLPVAVERSRAAERRAQELEARLEQKSREFADQIKRVEHVSAIALQRQKEQLEANYQHAMREAVQLGDVQRFDQLDRDRKQAVSQFDEQIIKAAPSPQQQPNQMPPEQAAVVDGWMKQNTWFHSDPEMNAVAQAYHMKLGREKPGLSLAENLEQTTKYVRQRYADKFGSGEQNIITPMVESGGGRMPASSGSRSKGANDLPAEVRKVAERFVKEGYFKSVNDYAREYFEQN